MKTTVTTVTSVGGVAPGRTLAARRFCTLAQFARVHLRPRRHRVGKAASPP
jgi:hypothetical protein